MAGSIAFSGKAIIVKLAYRYGVDAVTLIMADELFGVVASGQVRIPVERRYALAEAAQAHRDLEARLTQGCSVLLPPGAGA